MTEIASLLIPTSAKILDAIRCIDSGALQIALVTDDERRLMGIVTDGDIRRAILVGVSLTAEVGEVMNRQPHVAQEGTGNAELLRQLRRLNLRQLPLVDGEGRVVGICTHTTLMQEQRHTNPVVLMAGGLGTRLYPLTATTPKPMLAVGGKPLLETILENFIDHGFRRFFISLNYRSEVIREYFGDGRKFGIDIEYLEERERLGTAGSLSLLPERPRLPFIVMNGDILTSINFTQFLQFHAETEAMATMALHEYNLQIPYGVVETEGHKLVRIVEKPTHSFFINAGIYTLNPAALDHIPAGVFFDMPTLFEKLMAEGMTVSGFPIREYWLDIGQPQDLQRAEDEFERVFGSRR